MFAHVFGREPRGYVCGVGLGPTPTTLGIDGYRSCASTTVQMAIRACEKTNEQNTLLKGALHQLFDEVRELREIVKGGKRQEETLDDDATDRASSPTLEHGSNPSSTTQTRGVSSDNSDHNVHGDMMNSHDADVMVPMRGRAPLQPTRGHEGGGKEVVLLSAERPCGQPVAKATLQISNPEARVGGSLLGGEYHEVVVNSVMRGDHILPRQHGKLKTLADCVGHSIAWPHLNIVNEERATKTSKVQHLHQIAPAHYENRKKNLGTTL